MAPKRRGGPAQVAGTEHVNPVDTGDSPVPAFFETASGDENAPAEPAAGDASFEEESVAIQQPAFEAATPNDADSPVAPALEPHEEVAEPEAAPVVLSETLPMAERADASPGDTTLTPLDDAVSSSASLIGSVAGGIGLASIVGGGMVVIGLGAAVGAWYSVALANNYLKRRWETGRSGAA
jgi:hypothetical protein